MGNILARRVIQASLPHPVQSQPRAGSTAYRGALPHSGVASGMGSRLSGGMLVSARRQSWFLGIAMAVVGAVAVPGVADIGEEPAELFKRYGPGRQHNSIINFEVDRFTISVLLENGRSTMEIVARLLDDEGNRVEFSQSNPESRAAFTDADLAEILRRNAGGLGWMPGRSKNGDTIFIRQDRKIHAVYSPAQRTITFLALEPLAPPAKKK
jgi:hypothetical protein